ncbi:hybrid sensor histidine kinase/response regulator transcription factor [Massilibacteroides sp.]|uniref:hybrid sensor histidine kinase/response regulator transcription factor n=1 Tax=Massilibacteroides sp. TaxID=2034766 RepID=UPI0026142B81|nr:hybrid sensor histidine kinase/response regulator transcription factor [Massilibacteroides sp.]MDD4515932.1 two-component regulator propeller domain-containing protein [Massilibacteroides sp.]
MNLKLPLSILMLLLLLWTKGNAENRYFRHYNNKHGLSHNTVYASIQDRRGFMWFGTEDGLNRFDGHTFKVYRHNSFSDNSIPNDFIISLFEDSENKIWICTNKGVCFYDYRTETFHPFQLIPEQEHIEYFRHVKEDAYKNLWFITHNRIVRYSLIDKSHTVYPANEYFSPRSITITDEGLPLFSDGNTLYEYNKQTDSFTKTTILTPDEITSQTHIDVICQVADAGVFIGTDKMGLKFFNYHSRKVENVIPDTQIRDICSFNKHTYWIASESGVYIYNLLDKSLINLRKSLTNEYALSDNAIYSLTKDNEGGMWAGSFFGGVSYLPKQYTPFDYFIGGKTHLDMPGNAVREICPDQYGMIWFGTEDNGINKYNPKTGEITNYSYNNPQHPLSATNIHGLLAKENRLWVGTYNRGIDVIDLTSGRIIKRYTRASTQKGLESDFIVSFHATRSGELFAGTSLGVSLYDPEKDTFKPWKNIHTLIRQIYEDKTGNIWFATSNGVFHYIRETDEVHHYTNNPQNSQSIASNNTTSVFEDSKGQIWISTVNGLSLFNRKTGSFNQITAENGLPSNIVYRIVEDENGFFWLSTANGLVRFHPETYAMRVFTYTDGLHETQFNYSSSYKTPDGTIYMGTINGMIDFNPSRFKEDTFTPPVFITRVNVPDNKSNQYKSLPAESVETLTLPYNAATFSLSFVALSYTSPEAIRYAYKLENIDKEWIFMNGNKDVTFANLSPGKYVFKVKSTNSSGAWQENEYSLPILITPPFWQTGWAFSLYALLAGLSVFLFYSYKKRRLEEKHRFKRERFEAKKEKELYDAKIQFFTFITHEIRTPLTLIKAPLEKILKSGDGTADTKENLQTIERNTERLLNLSNQLLDFRKTESKGFKLHYTETDVSIWLQTILQPFLPVMKQKGKEFTINGTEKTRYAMIDREAFSKIISNLITNAIKYSDKKIALTIRNNQEEKTFSIDVVNDGLLIPESEREQIFTPFYRLNETIHQEGSGIGLSLAHSLTDFHQGKLTCTQTEDKQNCFTLTLPLLQVQEKTVSPDARESKSPESERPTILVVEDQEEMRMFISKELSSDYSVIEAADGKDALNQLNNHSADLIISDVMMPNMDGFELCNIVKNDINYSHIPFIILTAQHNLQSHLKGLNQGADAYLEKPFSIELLIAQTKNLIKNRILLNKAYKEKPLTEAASLSTSPADDLFLKKLTDCIEENIASEKLGVEMLASELGMSTSGLYRKVKGISGISPVEFIKIARLKKAVRLMKDGETRINEIAFKCGFSSPSYFSTSFLKQYGKSPSEFLRE